MNTMPKIAAVGLMAAAALCAGSLVASATTSDPAPHEPGALTLPACTSDDGAGADPCVWDADVDGDGSGLDFVAYHGRTYTGADAACVSATFLADQILAGDGAPELMAQFRVQRDLCADSTGGF